jgi:hypothetical protein
MTGKFILLQQQPIYLRVIQQQTADCTTLMPILNSKFAQVMDGKLSIFQVQQVKMEMMVLMALMELMDHKVQPEQTVKMEPMVLMASTVLMVPMEFQP